MSNKKTPVKRRRRRKALSSAPRRRTKRSSGGLRDMFNPTIAKHSAISTAQAAGGGMLAVTANKVIIPTSMGKMGRVGIALGVGFLASALGFEKVGSGFTGGMMALTFQNGLMNDGDLEDNTEFADEDVLSEQPVFLDENDQPMYLMDDGQGGTYYQYLNDEELSEWTANNYL